MSMYMTTYIHREMGLKFAKNNVTGVKYDKKIELGLTLRLLELILILGLIQSLCNSINDLGLALILRLLGIILILGLILRHVRLL